jgi:hypothetical protein
MKKILLILIPLMVAGCQAVSYVEKDPVTGIVIKEYHRSGFPDFSDGDNKVMPFGKISINGVGIENPIKGK